MIAVTRRSFVSLAAAVVLCCLAAPAVRAMEPATDVHEIKWFVHQDLITGARPLSFYEGIIADATANASALVKGGQGPNDNPCCMGFSDVSVATFADQGGEDLLEIDTEDEWDELNLIGGSGARGFIVQLLNWCGGPSSPIGCATTPMTCGSEPTTIILAIGMNAYDSFDSLAGTLAHERGHNSCLTHDDTSQCNLMSSISGGGCLSTSECADFVDDAQITSGSCDCYADASTYKADGMICMESVSGQCSGGLCDASTSDAGVQLFAAAGTNAIIGGTLDDPLLLSGAPGGWTDLGEFPSSQTIDGTAYSEGRATLYGIGPTDQLFTIDPTTGATTSVGTISGLDSGETLVSLAWDPGATSATTDDRLLSIGGGGGSDSLYEIDPDDAATSKIGNLNVTTGGQLVALAYDSANDVLYAGGPFSFGGTSGPATGLFTLPTSCGFCPLTEVDDATLVAGTLKFDPSLAYSATSGSIYHIGYQSGPRTEYDSYGADDLALGTVTKNAATRGLDGFAIGGLAAIPVVASGGVVPVASLGSGIVAGLGLLWGARRRLARRGAIG